MGTDDTTTPQDASSATGDANVTACMLIIGNEVLSGRTQDKNLSFLGTALGEIGIDMREARIIPDDPAIIVETEHCRALLTMFSPPAVLVRRMMTSPPIVLPKRLAYRLNIILKPWHGLRRIMKPWTPSLTKRANAWRAFPKAAG